MLELRNKSECCNFIESVKDNKHITAVVPKKNNPKVIIHDIESYFPECELVDAILRQNPTIQQCLLDTSQQMTKRFMKKTKDGVCQYAVLEVSPQIYKTMMKESKIFIGFSRCSVKSYTPVLRCFQCLGYSHVAADCQIPQHCMRCDDEHTIASCPESNTECIKCI